MVNRASPHRRIRLGVSRRLWDTTVYRLGLMLLPILLVILYSMYLLERGERYQGLGSSKSGFPSWLSGVC